MMHFLLASVEVDAEREQPMRQRRLVGKKKSDCEADTMWWMSESADNRLRAGVLCFVRYFIHNNILIVSLNWAAVWK